MPRATDIANGLLLFAKLGGHDVAAEHDEIYAGPDTIELSAEDRANLDKWGWHFSETFGSWMCFV